MLRVGLYNYDYPSVQTSFGHLSREARRLKSIKAQNWASTRRNIEAKRTQRQLMGNNKSPSKNQKFYGKGGDYRDSRGQDKNLVKAASEIRSMQLTPEQLERAGTNLKFAWGTNKRYFPRKDASLIM